MGQSGQVHTAGRSSARASLDASNAATGPPLDAGERAHLVEESHRKEQDVEQQCQNLLARGDEEPHADEDACSLQPRPPLTAALGRPERVPEEAAAAAAAAAETLAAVAAVVPAARSEPLRLLRVRCQHSGEAHARSNTRQRRVGCAEWVVGGVRRGVSRAGVSDRDIALLASARPPAGD